MESVLQAYYSRPVCLFYLLMLLFIYLFILSKILNIGLHCLYYPDLYKFVNSYKDVTGGH